MVRGDTCTHELPLPPPFHGLSCLPAIVLSLGGSPIQVYTHCTHTIFNVKNCSVVDDGQRESWTQIRIQTQFRIRTQIHTTWFQGRCVSGRVYQTHLLTASHTASHLVAHVHPLQHPPTHQSQHLQVLNSTMHYAGCTGRVLHISEDETLPSNPRASTFKPPPFLRP